MKIDSSIKGLAPRDRNVATRPASPGGAPVEAQSETVDLSGSTALQNAGASEGSSATFDTQRIAEIRQAIAEGRFQVNPERIADSLVDSVREMLAQRRGAA